MKIVIIGGGVSGLSAGIYAQKNGFESVIYEKNPLLGGLCSYWKRKGFLLDNCVHWLTGSSPSSDMYRIWQDLNVITPEHKTIQHPSFLRIEEDGKQVVIWQDIERTRRELKELSPEDSAEIDIFVDSINRYKSVVLPTIPKEMMSFFDIVKMYWKMRAVLPVHKRYTKMSIRELASRFKHPLLRRLCTDYFPDTYSAMTVFYTYATFCSGNGALPDGGSKGMVERMEKLYRELGGKVVAPCEVVKINIEKNRATGVTLSNGTVDDADWVIPACDTFETFSRLLPESFIDPFYKEKYDNPKKYRVTNSTNCYFGLDMKAGELMPHNAEIFDCEADMFGIRRFHVVMKHFDYDPSFAPEGKSVLQCMLSTNEQDYDQLKALYDNDRASYKTLKTSIGHKVMEALVEKYPQIKDNLTLLDVATPVTHNRYCNSYKGSFMGFSLTPFVEKESHNGRIKNLDNVILSGQWVQMPGGLPIAAVTGYFAIERIRNCVKRHGK